MCPEPPTRAERGSGFWAEVRKGVGRAQDTGSQRSGQPKPHLREVAEDSVACETRLQAAGTCFLVLWDFTYNLETQRDLSGDTVDEIPPANVGNMNRSLIWEDSTCHGAAKPMCYNH